MCAVSLAGDTEQENLVLQLPAEGEESGTTQDCWKSLHVFTFGEPGLDFCPD